jgi:hypothetical protein
MLAKTNEISILKYSVPFDFVTVTVASISVLTKMTANVIFYHNAFFDIFGEDTRGRNGYGHASK